jgi:hypothetical protein
MGGTKDGDYSGSWKQFKGAVGYWLRLIAIIIGAFLGSAILIFVAVKLGIYLRRRDLLNKIAVLEGELES